MAFVYMPEHLHLLVDPTDVTARVDRLLFAIKRPFSYRIKQSLIESGDPMLEALTVRERPGKSAFRFWQEGGGYDRNLRTEEAVLRAIDYIPHNPVRRGLCPSPDGWKWSSWKHYHRPEEPWDRELPEIARFPGWAAREVTSQ